MTRLDPRPSASSAAKRFTRRPVPPFRHRSSNLGAGNPEEHAMTKSRDQKKETKKKPAKTAKEKKAEKNAKKAVKSFAPT
jgi:hypothetical protein